MPGAISGQDSRGFSPDFQLDGAVEQAMQGQGK